MHFAGEHTAPANQGFLEGAGVAAARGGRGRPGYPLRQQTYGGETDSTWIRSS